MSFFCNFYQLWFYQNVHHTKYPPYFYSFTVYFLHVCYVFRQQAVLIKLKKLMQVSLYNLHILHYHIFLTCWEKILSFQKKYFFAIFLLFRKLFSMNDFNFFFLILFPFCLYYWLYHFFCFSFSSMGVRSYAPTGMILTFCIVLLK